MSIETKQKRSKIPYIFLAFFGVIFLVNIFYIYLANKTWRGIVTEGSYQKGINYNQILELAKIQKTIGWKINLKYTKQSNQSGALTVDIVDKNQTKITDAIVSVTFKRPTQEGFDFAETLKFTKGTYRGDIKFPLPGQWDVEVSAVRGEESAHEVKRYIIQ
jgi:nitrogen fixation protein FixH